MLLTACLVGCMLCWLLAYQLIEDRGRTRRPTPDELEMRWWVTDLPPLPLASYEDPSHPAYEPPAELIRSRYKWDCSRDGHLHEMGREDCVACFEAELRDKTHQLNMALKDYYRGLTTSGLSGKMHRIR